MAQLPKAQPARPRHRAPEAARGGAEEEVVADPELDSYLAALSGGGDHPTELTGRFGHAQVFQLRLPALRIEQLRRLAEERGVSPGALAVDWVIERLDREDTPTGPLPVVEEEPSRWRNLRRFGRR
ncbi:hypothetical protein BJF78_35020 [Pseudonocardia sp. CNS-139]|nr:hypothetical protein BJF78_35020 [Pseudonocardia sp. CNS-139]